MNERLRIELVTEQVRHIIKSKNWYSLTESSRFLWHESLELMAEMIGREIGPISIPELQEAIESSFSTNSLAISDRGFFIDSLLEIDSSLILWSEGDVYWQEKKANNSGIHQRAGLRINFFSKNKQFALENIISSLKEESEVPICVVVIDDKEKNLAHAREAAISLADDSCFIETCLVNLKDSQFDPNSCLKFLSELILKGIRIKLIVDMDGVVLDTDRVLNDVAASKIAAILVAKE